MITLTQFILQLIPMLILSGVLVFTVLLVVFRLYDWWVDR